MTPEQLVEIPGIGEKMVEKIHQSVAAYFEALEAQAVAPIEPSTEDEAAAESVEPDPETAPTEAAEATEATELRRDRSNGSCAGRSGGERRRDSGR